jgi:flagellum-specific ATP synthase
VLVDGDDMNEPVADAVRAILDGHVVLSRDLAHAGHYPAIDVLGSVSRLIDQVVPADIRMAGQELRRLMAALREKEDLISIGAYQPGSDPTVDTALAKRTEIAAFLQQAVEHCSTAAEADTGLLELVMGGDAEEALAADLAVADEAVAMPAVEPGASAIPPLHLSV